MRQTLTELYDARVAAGDLRPDAAQRAVLPALEEVRHWLEETSAKRRGLLGGLFAKPPAAPKGLYLWGGVGRGKSMLMDLFYETVAIHPRRRVHFHAFMQEVHERIQGWRQREKEGLVKSGDPIPSVAAAIAKQAALLCFDEFQVQDIADASILGRLFTQLFDLGVVVVATSNIAPDDLYAGGLNRQRLLPFIALVKERMDVLHLDSATDYRLDRIKGLPVYHTPLGEKADAALDDAFVKLTDAEHGEPMTLALKGRAVAVPEARHGVARFTFAELCARPLGAADYLKIAQCFHTVIIRGVPVMGPERRNEAKRFVTLVDALYEAKTKLILSADVSPDGLYPQGDTAFEFKRTASRLLEMQSLDYLDLRSAD